MDKYFNLKIKCSAAQHYFLNTYFVLCSQPFLHLGKVDFSSGRIVLQFASVVHTRYTSSYASMIFHGALYLGYDFTFSWVDVKVTPRKLDFRPAGTTALMAMFTLALKMHLGRLNHVWIFEAHCHLHLCLFCVSKVSSWPTVQTLLLSMSLLLDTNNAKIFLHSSPIFLSNLACCHVITWWLFTLVRITVLL